MATKIINVSVSGSYADGYHLAGVHYPRGNWTVTDISFGNTELQDGGGGSDVYCYCDVQVHNENTGWSYMNGPYGDGTGFSVDEYVVGEGNIAIVSGAPTDMSVITQQAYSGNYVINSGKWGAVLFQINSAGVVSTKVSADPQNYLTSNEAINNLPSPDPGSAAWGGQVQLGPWTANTDAGIASGWKTAKRTGGSDAASINDEYPVWISGEGPHSLLLIPSPTGVASEVLTFMFYTYNNISYDPVTVVGGYIQVTLTNDLPDDKFAEGRGEARVTVTGTGVANEAFFNASARGEARTSPVVFGDTDLSVTVDGQSRMVTSVRTPGVGQVRLDGVGLEVLSDSPRLPVRATTQHINLVGVDNTAESRATAQSIQLAGRQDEEDSKGDVTHLSANMLGRQVPAQGPRVTWLSVQMAFAKPTNKTITTPGEDVVVVLERCIGLPSLAVDCIGPLVPTDVGCSPITKATVAPTVVGGQIAPAASVVDGGGIMGDCIIADGTTRPTITIPGQDVTEEVPFAGSGGVTSLQVQVLFERIP